MSNRQAIWITTTDLAVAAAMSERHIRRVLQRGSWNGHQLVTRQVKGRAGRAGIRYEVRLDSLPTILQRHWSSGVLAPIAVQSDNSADNHRNQNAAPFDDAESFRSRERIAAAVNTCLKHPINSKERGTAVKAAAVDCGVSIRTVQRWIANVERFGSAALIQKARSDARRKRVVISRCYDAVVLQCVGRDALLSIENELRTVCRSVFNSPITSSRERRFAVRTWLISRTRYLGIQIGERELARACLVPYSYIRRYRHHRVPYIKRHDTSYYMEHHQPRARRRRDGLWFGSVVCLDCTALDIVLHRDDGTEYTARVVGFQDLASNTMFFHLVFPARGKGITQAHIAEAFIAWCKRFGVPGSVLIDNGSEFRKIGALDDLMKLSTRIGIDRLQVLGKDVEPELAQLVRDRLLLASSAVHKARPYNPQSKAIEGQFGNITRWFLPVIQGWIGGDRVRQPTQRQGQRAQHFNGTPDQLREQIEDALRFYDMLPQRGNLKGMSPAEKRTADIEAGVQRVDVNIDALIEHWSIDYKRTVRQGEIQIPKLGRYWHPKLGTLIKGTRVIARVPLVGDKARIAVLDEYDELLCFAAPVVVHHHLDIEGARSQRDRAAAQNAELAAMEAETVPFNPLEARRQFVSMQDTPPELPSAGIIQIDKVARKTAAARRALPRADAIEISSNADVWAELDALPISEPATEAIALPTRRQGAK